VSLKKMLIAMGYSEKAVEEILKWYVDEGAKGHLHPSRSSRSRKNR